MLRIIGGGSRLCRQPLRRRVAACRGRGRDCDCDCDCDMIVADNVFTLLKSS